MQRKALTSTCMKAHSKESIANQPYAIFC